MEVKGLSGIVAMHVGLNNEMVVWEVRWKQLRETGPDLPF